MSLTLKLSNLHIRGRLKLTEIEENLKKKTYRKSIGGNGM